MRGCKTASVVMVIFKDFAGLNLVRYARNWNNGTMEQWNDARLEQYITEILRPRYAVCTETAAKK